MTNPTDAPAPDSRRWWTLATIGVGTFMSALDGSVVNTVLPLLRRDLHTTVAGVEWVMTIYLLIVSSILLGVGRLGDLRGHKRMYIGGFFLFVAGSALCGLARTIPVLVGFRAFQALGAAMLFATAPAILTRTFPAQQRGRALGTQGTFTYLGLTAGPSLGGWLASVFGWQAIFYINVPVGAIAITLAFIFINDDRPESRSERFDFAGAALFTAGLVSLLIALNQGHAWGWSDRRTVALLVLAAVILGAFIALERRRPFPMLDLSLFRSRLFSTSVTGALLNYMAVFSVLFVVPFLLIQGHGLDTRHAGLVLTAQPIVMALVAPFSGSLSDRIGSRWLVTAGMALLCGGLVFLALLPAAASIHSIAAGLAIVGFGVGVFVSPNNSALMGAAPRNRQGIASGVLATARNVGMVLGVGISGAVLTTILATGIGGPTAALIHGVRASLLVGAFMAAAGAVVVASGGTSKKRDASPSA